MGSGFRVQGSGFRVQGSRLRVYGLVFRVSGLAEQPQPECLLSFRFRVDRHDSGIRVSSAWLRELGTGDRPESARAGCLVEAQPRPLSLFVCACLTTCASILVRVRFMGSASVFRV